MKVMVRALAGMTALVAISVSACRSSSSTVPSTVPSTASPAGAFQVPRETPLPRERVTQGMGESSQDAPDAVRFREVADSAISAPAWSNARWGLLVIDATTGDTLFSNDANKLFMPASNQKLLTSAIALENLGPDFRWRTPVFLVGEKRGAVWHGDLQIAGSGDPTFSDSLRGGNALSGFDPIVRALAARGISRISGSVVSTRDAFAGPTTGFGWEIDDLDESYGAPVDELLFNEGELVLRAYSAKNAEDQVLVTLSPTPAYPAVVNRAVTREARGADAGEPLRAVYDSSASAIVLTGTLPRGDSARFTLSYRHPADAFIAAVRARLEAAGIGVDQSENASVDVSIGNSQGKPSDVRADTLVVLLSATLSDVLPRLQKPSQNQIAEMLFRTSGATVSGVGSADSARAVAVRTLEKWGVGVADAAYRDGSGLSRHDYVTPAAIVKVLTAMRAAPWFDVYRNALPLAGVDGTLRNRMKNSPAAGNAQAKTGTVDKARSLSGYVTSADGHQIIFSMLCNNFTLPTREVERVQDLLVVTLAASRFGASARERPR